MTANLSLVNSLNTYNSINALTFKVNNGKGFTLSSQFIPNPFESGEHTFNGWFEDKKCTSSPSAL